jgi:hypothetical protein
MSARSPAPRLPGIAFAFLAVALLALVGGCDTNEPETNRPPVAVLGPDMTVHVGALVQLNGSASYDPEDKTLTYSWSLTSRPAGSSATLSGPASPTPSFTADAMGTYVVQLIVHDGEQNSAAASCTVTSANGPPVANAGQDQTAKVDETVHLNGATSSDPDNDPLTWAWSFMSRPAGSAATLSSPTAMNPTFTVDRKGPYVVQLIVTDEHGTSSNPDQSTVTGLNTLPVANAGPDQNVTQGVVVQLNGSASSDADGDALSFSWAFASRPAGSVASLSSPTAMNPTFTADLAGDYALDLTVHDGEASSTADRVMVISTGGPTPGLYSGTTSGGKPINFVVSADRSSIQSGFEITFFVTCTYCSGTAKLTFNFSLPLTAGHFSYSRYTSGTPGYLAISGDATSQTTFSGTAAYRDDPPSFLNCGSCSLVQVTWTATWIGPVPALGADAGLAAQPESGFLRTVRDGMCIDRLMAVRK